MTIDVQTNPQPAGIVRRPGSRRGTAYLLVLMVSLLVTVIGLSSLLESRVQRRASEAAADLIAARSYALSAIEVGLWQIDNWSTWRSNWTTGWLPTNQTIGDGTLSLEAVDPIDGDLKNNTTDPVVLTGIGMKGAARHKMQVTVEFDTGEPQFAAGSWKQVVD